MTTNQLPANVQERIKADAQKAAEGIGDEHRRNAYYHGHRDGATAENERAQCKEKVFEDTMQRILNVASWSDDPYKSTLLRVVNTAREQWNEGKESEPEAECTCSLTRIVTHGKCYKCPELNNPTK